MHTVILIEGKGLFAYFLSKVFCAKVAELVYALS
jgi:hypothetical protein